MKADLSSLDQPSGSRQLRSGRRRCGILALCCLSLALSLTAQPATNVQRAAGLPADQLKVRLAEARAELSLISALPAGSTNLPPGATATEAQEYQLLAESLVRTYQEHLDLLLRLDETRQQLGKAGQKLKAGRGVEEPGPHSVLLVDELRDTVQTLKVRRDASETTRRVLLKLNEDLESTLKKSDERLRLLAEQLELAKDSAQTMRLTWQRGFEQLRNRLFAAMVSINETRRQQVEIALAEDGQQLALARRQLAIAGQKVRFSPEDLAQVLRRLEAEHGESGRELLAAEAEFESRRKELLAAREELRLWSQSATNAAAPAAREALGRRQQSLVELREALAETSAQRLVVLRQVADALLRERGMWQMRFASFHSQDLAILRESYQRLDHLGRLILSAKPHFQQQIDVAARLIAEQRNRIRTRLGSEDDPAAAQALLDTYLERERLAQRALRNLERLERLASRWQESLDADRQHLPLGDRIRDLFGSFSSFATRFWQFELFAAEDTITVDGQPITGRRSVTVGKVVLALLILTFGYWLSNLLARLLERLAVKHLRVEINQASLIRRWIRVVLVLGLVVFSLVSVKIPLTVFAFLGGALAIGLGFGTQNLLKNFISGIIILFERPFRVGDVLDIGGQRGTIISVGIRSSVLKLFDGTEILIPNSALLENNLTNWTYSDRQVRFSLTVGVAYGSDTRRVAQLLAEAADRHGLVQKDPPPQVIFRAFGDNALQFELRYWVDVIKQNAAQVGSDLHHMVAGEFAQHGIVMAFPQRDLHLDVTRPVPVQIVSSSSARSESEPCPAGLPVEKPADASSPAPLP